MLVGWFDLQQKTNCQLQLSSGPTNSTVKETLHTTATLITERRYELCRKFKHACLYHVRSLFLHTIQFEKELKNNP